MTLYVAFLRGINVGGRNLLKMQDVRQRFSALGLANVSSYKASGNNLYETDMKIEESYVLSNSGITSLLGNTRWYANSGSA